ncbi:MAG: (4Fe-4S)-binding protein [Clostridia bacterium]|nr:(4Fe-4S)-binding protein [Clostridia bacterium]
MGFTKEDVQRVKLDGFLLNNNGETFSCRVITGNGTLTAQELADVSALAAKYGAGHCAFTTRLTVEIPGIRYEDIDAVKAGLAACGLTAGGTGAKVRPVVACKGTVCTFGFYDTQALALKIHERFYVGMGDVRLPHKFKITVGGCPNNCVKPNLNDFGIMGQRPPLFDEEKCRGCKVCQIEKVCRMHACALTDGKMTRDTQICNNCGYCVDKCPFHAVSADEVRYKLFVGGRWGRLVRFGTELPGLFTEEETLDMIEKTLLLFRERGNKGERLAAMVERLGEDEIVNALLHGDVLARRTEILSRAF